MSTHETPTLLQLRGTFLLPEFQAQGLTQRMGEGQLFHAIALTEEYLVVHTDASVSLRSIQTQEILWEIDCPSLTWAFHGLQNLLALVLEDVTILLWDLHTGQIVQRLTYEDAGNVYQINPNSLAFNQDGSILAAGMHDVVVLWDVVTGQRLHVLPVPYEDMWIDITTFAFHPSGMILAGGSFNEDKVWFWNVQDGRLITTWDLLGDGDCNDRSYDLAFNPEGTLLFAAYGHCGLRIWDHERQRQLPGPTTDIRPIWVEVDPMGRYLAVMHSDGHHRSVRLLEMASWRVVDEYTSTRPRPFFSRDRQFLTITDSMEGLIILRHVETGQELGRMHLHTAMGITLDMDLSGQILASGPVDSKTVLLWSLKDGSVFQRLTLPAGSDAGTALALSPDGCLCATTESTRLKHFSIIIWHVTDGTAFTTFEGHTYFIQCVAFHPNNRILASGSTDKTLRLWDVSQKQEIHCWEGHTAAIKCITFAPDGLILASGSLDKTIRLWKTENGQLLWMLKHHEAGISTIAFSPNGQLLASGDEHGVLCIWNIGAQNLIRCVQMHTKRIHSLAWSPNEHFLVSSSDDPILSLYDCVHSQKIPFLKTYQNTVDKVAFSPDGSTLMTSDGHCVRFGEVDTLISR